MKRNKIYIYALLGLSLGSCSKALDINDNPNSPTASTPELVFPQALVATAKNVVSFNNYGSQLVGYRSNGGGVSGWGSIVTYNYTTTDFNGLWSSSYDILTDLQYVESASKPVNQLDFYYASKLLKVYNYQNLVDTYNDIPYSQALKGTGNLTPSYDKAEDIYKDLGSQLDSVITYFKTSSSTKLFTSTDFMFKGDGKKWAQFANTLKLRLVLRANGKVQFANSSFDTGVGFIGSDVIANPGFVKNDGKQNPMWNSWAYAYDGTAVGAASQYTPTPYIMAFYNGNKVSDASRGNLVYKSGTSTGVNQLGYQLSDAAKGLAPSSWFLGTSSTVYTGKGLLKGPASGQPLLLASESYFLQAEAALKGLISGDAKVLFENGIKSSYDYLNKNESDVSTVDAAGLTSYLTAYKTANSTSYLVNYDLATTTDQKLEAIITQKYIASNFLFGHQSWYDYLRTNYPKNSGAATTANKLTTFVSITSEATAADKLPTRIMYPNTEFNYNASNVPTIDKYTSKIFWAK